MHHNVVTEAQKQAGEHADQVNWETGQVLSYWDEMYNGVVTAWNWVRGIFGKDPLPLRGSVKENGRQALKRQNATLRAKGTPPGDRHLGGPAIVGEEGRELAYIPGQGVTMLGSRGPEFLDLPAGTSVLPNKYTESLLRMYGFPGYADGVGDFFNVFLKGTGAAWDFIKNKFSLGSNFPSWLTNLAGNPITSMGDMAKDALKNLFGDFTSSGAAGSGVQRWAGVAAQALMMTGQYTKANLDRLLYQMQTESGGNPQSINLWDSNAKRGIPSKGLMQVIDPTFRAYAMPGYNSIWDPLSNILASIRYSLARYGSLARAYQGHGYATGGEINSQQYAMLGENGYKEWVITSEPRYRSSNLDMWAAAGQALGVPTIPNVSTSNGYGASAATGLGVVVDRLNQVIDKFEEAINNPIYLEAALVADGRELGRASYKYVTEFQDKESGRKSRFGG
jgi:SLT domain-containing protein